MASCGIRRCFHLHSSRHRFGQTFGERSIVTKEQIDTYQEDGVICLRQIFESKWLLMLWKGYEKVCQSSDRIIERKTDGHGNFYLGADAQAQTQPIEEYLEFIKHSPAAEVAGRLMKSSLAAFIKDSTVHHKAICPTYETAWHQDQVFQPCDGPYNCSVWIPLTPVGKHLKFIRKSHLVGLIPKMDANEDNYDEVEHPGLLEVVNSTSEENIVAYELEPGDCIVFNTRTIHTVDYSFLGERLNVITRWAADDAAMVKWPWKVYPPQEDAYPSDLKLGDKWWKSKHTLVPWKDIDY